MPLPTGSNLISLQDGHDMIALYQMNKKGILATGVDDDILPTCETFLRADWDSLLAQDGCVGVRIYLGMKTNNDICVIACGVDENNEDMVGKLLQNSANDIIIDQGQRCPNVCPPSSDLNS